MVFVIYLVTAHKVGKKMSLKYEWDGWLPNLIDIKNKKSHYRKPHLISITEIW